MDGERVASSHRSLNNDAAAIIGYYIVEHTVSLGTAGVIAMLIPSDTKETFHDV